jgi:GDP-D-mannose dehydratase
VELLLGAPTKIRGKLGWKPQVSFTQVVQMMMDSVLILPARDKTSPE